MPLPTDDQLYRAAQVLAEHLSRGVHDDVTEAAGLRSRARSDELHTLVRTLARTVDAYGMPTRDVLAATGFPQEVIDALDPH